MPHLISHIDAIARAKGRDVLYVEFPPCQWEHDYNDFAPRQQIIEWLDTHQIAWENCGDIASENGFDAYAGQIYIDVPFDETDTTYRVLADFLETPEGETKIEGSRFCALPLRVAMRNAHHDESGFWDRWAENF